MNHDSAVRERTVAIGSLRLDGGETLPAVEQRVTIYGTPDADGSNVVFAAHALTGSSRIADWWPGLVGDGGLFEPPLGGDGALFDPPGWCVIGINALGSCYGSTGPQDDTFPRITVRDIVAAQARALDELGIEQVAVTIGGSLGGMQALQWALDYPHRVGQAVVIGAHDHHSAMGIGLNAVQRDALALDRVRGLRLARKIAMLTYKSEALLTKRHDRRPDRNGAPRFDVEGYLELQADRLASRMSPYAYATLTHAMDSFDVRNAYAANTHIAAANIRSAASVIRSAAAAGTPNAVGANGLVRDERPKLTFVGISSDWLFRPQDVRAAAARFAARGFDSGYLELESDHGHDAFLADVPAVAALLRPQLTTRCHPERSGVILSGGACHPERSAEGAQSKEPQSKEPQSKVTQSFNSTNDTFRLSYR
jgi:homoserine O-acetyltransferase